MQLSQNKKFPTDLPILVEDELFLYPFMITPLFISDEKNKRAIDLAIKNESMIMVVSSTPEFNGDRSFGGIYHIGVIGTIMRTVPLPDGRVKILFQGSAKGKILHEISQNPLFATIGIVHDERGDEAKIDASINVLKERVKALSSLTHFFPNDLLKTIEENTDASRICDLTLSALRVKKEIAYSFFSQLNLEKRIFDLIAYIADEIESYRLEKEIKSKVHSKIDQTNKEYFLKEQLKQIQKELGSDSDREVEIEEYRKKLDLKKPFISDEAYKEIKKQIDKFARLHPDSADAGLSQSYLDWVLEIPFEQIAKEKLSIQSVSKQLNKDHYSLEKPKERIEEYFALKELLELRGSVDKEGKRVNNGAILCFYGPPGVGKTSLANSIATALKRKLIRIALGGLEDVNELRGHRRTYVGAMPGRLVQGLIGAKQMNPVVVLDEIDKVSTSYKGDPTAVLLEILDPEQNSAFRDYYLNFDIDLSKIIFIATANDISQIPAPLRDRMEFIGLSSYTPQEKFQIAKNYLIPQELERHGLKPADISFHSTALEKIIAEYTRESGVRNLRRQIATICRKIAVRILKDSEFKKLAITTKNLEEFLDKKVFEIDAVKKTNQIGIVNGLAWTSVGGDVLKIEAIKIKGKGAMTITGQLGDVMKESAQIAFSVIKVLIDNGKLKFEKSANLAKDEQIYNKFDLHIHVPEGATPKDGPSAGITLATAIASILSEKKVRFDVAMTGEITLSGAVLAIGGLKEKLIAAHKAKITHALIPRKNFERDLDEIPDEVKNAMQITPVDHIEDVLKIALV
ncbi:endopeptidase La [Campylobacter sp. JMF_04 NA10]|uniref:endopeptidase La n=1 Tax=Campylobacter sp. JMF_04 NA10 TaxID=2983824 RepID=UPI0022E9B3E0|nr:endopeptidase La [Campylobacter sp. JMF_04 NA10]MDA3076758.1 endopeptidase La [Campylobacter sp. JMF_04 NA10]